MTAAVAPISELENLKIAEEAPQKARKCAGRSDMALGEITHHNVLQLKTINQSVFPVTYNDKFYKDVLINPKLAKFAYFNDIVVGAVCCRMDQKDNENSLYIMTLGTLAPYRRLGVGKMLLNYVFEICNASEKPITSVNLHVQTNNDEALEFYKKFGFEVIGTAERYYKRIEPDNAYILTKKIDRK